jgi:hypothetical protein
MSDYGQVSTDIQRIYTNCITLKSFDTPGDRLDLLPANPDRKFLSISVFPVFEFNIDSYVGIYFGIESKDILNQFTPPGGIILSWQNISVIGEDLFCTPLPNLILQYPLPQQSISLINFSFVDQTIHIIEF